MDFCAGNLLCVPNDTGIGGVCLPPAAQGQPCEALFQCRASVFEYTNLICDENTHTCVPAPSTGPCVVYGALNTCDPETSACVPVDGGVPGTCQPFLPAHAPCVEGESVCAPNAGTCMAAQDGGTPTCTPQPICTP